MLEGMMSDSKQLSPVRPIDIRYRTRYKAISEDWFMENHFHNDYELIFILDGKIELKINNKTYVPEKNSLVFINNMELHGYRILEYPYTRYVIMLKPDFLQSAVNEPLLTSIFQHRPNDFSHVMNVPAEYIPSLRAAFHTMYREFKGYKAFRETNLKLYLYQLLISLYRLSEQQFPMSKVSTPMNNVIALVQNHIEEHYMEELSLKDVSKLFYTDMYYLCHLFKNVTGYTFKSYLIQQRISKAKDMLAYKEDDITEVGLDCGFNNVNHFIRTFKKMLGITPYQYRKKCKDNSTF
jgi:AraC-like DNA-binding protein